MLSINSYQEYESLSIKRNIFPTKLESGNPFLIPQIFEFLSSESKSMDFDTPMTIDKFKSDELIANFLDRQIELSSQKIKRLPQNVQTLNNLGLSYFNKGDYDYASYWFNEALKLDKKSISSLSNLAKIHVIKGNTKEALSIYKTLENINPNDLSTLNNIGFVFIIEKDLVKAKEYFNRVIKLNKNDAHAFNNIGLILLIEKKIDEAINYFRQAISVKDNLASAYNNIGLCYALRKDYKKATRFFLSSLSYNKFDIGSLINLSQTYQLTGKHNEAIRILTEFIDSGHDDIRIREFLAWSYFSLKDYQRALKVLINLLNNKQLKEQDHANTFNNIAVIYQHLKNYDKAETYFNLCLNLESSRKSLYFQNLIKFYLDIDKNEKAKKLIDQGMAEYHNDPDIIECLGRYYYEIEDYEKSITELNYAISKKPDLTEAYALLSVIEMEYNSDTNKAHDILIKALSFNQDNVGLLNNLAYNYLLKGNIAEARNILDKVNAPDNLYITATRGLLLLKEGNIEEGSRLYNIAEAIASPNKGLQYLVRQKKYLELARYYYKENKIREAKEYLKKAISLKAKHRHFRDQAIQLLNEVE